MPSRLEGIETGECVMLEHNFSLRSHVPSRLEGIETSSKRAAEKFAFEEFTCAFPFGGN